MQANKRIPIIVIFLVFALGGLGYYLNMVLIPKVKENKAILQQKEEILDIRKREYEAVKELDSTFAEIETEVNTALAALPSEKQIPDIPYQLAAIADRHSLTNFNWSLSTTPVTVPRANIQSLGITLSFVGSYDEIISYLQSLENSLRLIDISNIAISGSSSMEEDEAPLTVSLQANAYYTPN